MDAAVKSHNEQQQQQDRHLISKVYQSLDNIDAHITQISHSDLPTVITSSSNDDLLTKLDYVSSQLDTIWADLNTAMVMWNMPKYEYRRCEQRIQALELALNQARARLFPRRKFRFENKMKVLDRIQKEWEEWQDKESENESNAPMEGHSILTVGSIKSVSQVATIPIRSSLRISDHPPHSTLYYNQDQLANTDVDIQDLAHGTIYLLGVPSATRFRRLHHCKVFCGPVAGPAFFADCAHCEFHISARQIRIHDSKDTVFCLLVPGAPIIEGCQQLSFAPYMLDYDGLQSHLELAKLDPLRNEWSNVKDFDWLVHQEPSANWKLLDSTQWITHKAPPRE